MHIKPFTLGDWMTNCYVVRGSGSACWIVDAGFEPAPMLDYIEREGLEPRRLVLTHAHVDHIAGVAAVREQYPELEILIHEAERDFPGDAALNLSVALAQPVIAPEPTTTLGHGQTLELDELRFQIRHTSGHSPGGITLYEPDQGVALVGDALFAGSIGRTDFPTSDHARLIASIREQLLTLPDPTRVLPGHGPETTIGAERGGNPFL